MNLLEIMQAKGFVPKKVSSTNGGEYHSPCPGCGGEDRFSIQLGKNRYYCRQCKATGDAIQFLREFDHHSFTEAAALVGKTVFSVHSASRSFDNCDRALWQQVATDFVLISHQKLLRNEQGIALLHDRGIHIESIRQHHLGWQSNDQWRLSTEWGFSIDAKKVYLPAGIIIPAFESGKALKLKIRRVAWHPGDKFPKYLEVRGSAQKTILLGQREDRPTMILESELDAILMSQIAGDLCNYAALGGANKRPDHNTMRFFHQCPVLFFALDYDEAGIVSYQWWKNQFSNLMIWVPPKGKSPGEALQEGVDLRIWMQKGLDMAYSIIPLKLA